MELYNRLSQTSLRLLTKYGRDATLVRKSVGGGDYDPATGMATLPPDLKETRKVLVSDQPGSQIGQRFGTNFEAGTKIQKKEKWFHMDANGVPPALEDLIVLDKTEYTVIDWQEFSPGGKPLLYLVVCRA